MRAWKKFAVRSWHLSWSGSPLSWAHRLQESLQLQIFPCGPCHCQLLVRTSICVSFHLFLQAFPALQGCSEDRSDSSSLSLLRTSARAVVRQDVPGPSRQGTVWFAEHHIMVHGRVYPAASWPVQGEDVLSTVNPWLPCKQAEGGRWHPPRCHVCSSLGMYLGPDWCMCFRGPLLQDGSKPRGFSAHPAAARHGHCPAPQ